MINLKDIPSGALMSQAYVPAVAAVTATVSYAVFMAPVDCKILAVWAAPNTAITGDNTDYETLSIIDGGLAGAGTAVLGTAVSLLTGTNPAINDPIALVAAADVETLDAGDVMLLKNAKVSSGLAIPALLVTVMWWPTGETLAT